MKYALKEVYSWSVSEPGLKYRYVEVTNPDTTDSHPQVLELPTPETTHLCGSMTSPAIVFALLAGVIVAILKTIVGAILLAYFICVICDLFSIGYEENSDY